MSVKLPQNGCFLYLNFNSLLVNIITLSDTLLDSKLTKENVIPKIKEAFEISDKVDKYLDEQFLAENKGQND